MRFQIEDFCSSKAFGGGDGCRVKPYCGHGFTIYRDGAYFFQGMERGFAGIGLVALSKGVFEREILSFLHVCKTRHESVSIRLMKSYLQETGEQESSASRLALLWFVKQASVSGDRVESVKPTSPVNKSSDQAVGSVATEVMAKGVIGRNDSVVPLRLAEGAA